MMPTPRARLGRPVAPARAAPRGGAPRRRGPPPPRAAAPPKPTPDADAVERLKQGLARSGMDAKVARATLKAWQLQVGHEVTPEDLRTLLVRASSRAAGLVALQALLDAAAAAGAFTIARLVGDAAGEDYGLLAAAGQALAYFVFGWYAVGAVFDVFKLGAVAVATLQYNLNAGAFLAAVEALAAAGGASGLSALDKAKEAAGSVKVLQAVGKMAELLREAASKEEGGGAGKSKLDMLADLGAYLALERAQRMGFDAAKAGMTDAQAARAAVIFAKYDTNDDGNLSGEEFRRLCAEYAPTLDASEAAAALALVDADGNGSLEFDEFCRWWTGGAGGSGAAS